MNLKLILFLLVFIFTSQKVHACCAEDDRTLTEVMLDSNATIFSFKVLNSFNDKGSLYSKAIIDKVYFGRTLSQTVVIHTGNLNSSVGGILLKEGSKYLIFAQGLSDKYGGFGNCDRWSMSLENGDTARLGMLVRYKSFVERKGMPQWIERTKDGKIIAVGAFKDKKPISSWYFYHPNGKLKREAFYDNKHHLKYDKRFNAEDLKLHFVFYQNGRNEHEESYSTDSDNYLQSIIYYTYRDNTRLETITILNKLQQVQECYTQISNIGNNIQPNTAKYGLYQRFHENGRLAESGQYHRGLKYGIWFSYNEDGSIKTKDFLENLRYIR